MHSPDLIQRIFSQANKGNDENLNRVLNDLRPANNYPTNGFEWEGRIIQWICFESRTYQDVINEYDGAVYFYLRDEALELEVVIAAGTQPDDSSKPLYERNFTLHYVWVLGKYFPGLAHVPERPLKIKLPKIKKPGQCPIKESNYWFRKILDHYQTQPIYQSVDFIGAGSEKKSWRKISDGKRSM